MVSYCPSALTTETIFVGCVVDISQRKQADEQIRTLSLAVEQSPSIIIITDIHGDVTYVNPAF
ncbi:MAG: PAS domain-containing protein [Rhodoferax sp.]|nr:PAS domain-containing protein [Rhodoferax sp.]